MSSGPIDLSEIRLELINGSNNGVYASYALGELAPTIAPGQFLVLANAGVAVDPSAISGLLPSNGLQNGAPDGVKLVNTRTQDVIDSLSYEGDIAGVSEGVGVQAMGSDLGDGGLGRCPDGADRDDNSQDFSQLEQLTPGQINTCD